MGTVGHAQESTSSISPARSLRYPCGNRHRRDGGGALVKATSDLEQGREAYEALGAATEEIESEQTYHPRKPASSLE